VAAIAAATEHVPLPAAAGEGEDHRGGGQGDDAVELARLVEAVDLLDAADMAAVDEDLWERHALAMGKQCREFRE
jgi:hypothetical protein